MVQQLINRGTFANAGNGDSLHASALKINNNFTELYQAKPSNWTDATLTNVAVDLNCLETNRFLIDPADAPDETARVIDIINAENQSVVLIKVRGHATRTVSLDPSIDGDSFPDMPTDPNTAIVLAIIPESANKHASVHTQTVTWSE